MTDQERRELVERVDAYLAHVDQDEQGPLDHAPTLMAELRAALSTVERERDKAREVLRSCVVSMLHDPKRSFQFEAAITEARRVLSEPSKKE